MPGDTRIIIIGPRKHLKVTIGRGKPKVLLFTSVAEFNRWQRRPPRNENVELSAVVDEILRGAARATEAMPTEIELALSWLRNQKAVPTLKAFAEVACSRSTFYRRWRKTLTISSATFLERVRRTYAMRLLANGMPMQEAVPLTGVLSVAELQRLLR